MKRRTFLSGLFKGAIAVPAAAVMAKLPEVKELKPIVKYVPTSIVVSFSGDARYYLEGSDPQKIRWSKTSDPEDWRDDLS